MAGEFSGEDAGEELVGMLKNLGKEEILEVLSGGGELCLHCQSLLKTRVQNLVSGDHTESSASFLPANSSGVPSPDKSSKSSIRSTSWSSILTSESVNPRTQKGFVNSSPSSVNSKQKSFDGPAFDITLNGGLSGATSLTDNGLSDDQKEQIRFAQVGRKKDFVHIEWVDGKKTNVLQGLELYTKVFNSEEQKKIVDCVYSFQRMGQQGKLRARTYSEPRKWMRGKGRVTIQFGCCYNYAMDKNGNPPGIIRDEEVDPLPPLFKQMIKRLVRWHVLPPTCVPDSCIVNIYDEGDCIPPHIDHHDFLRPFCTVSFLAECNILFGANLKVVNPGEFSGPVSIPLPVGSVLILNGNGADVAKHCVPGVPARRISITFRKMDTGKQPYTYSWDSELVGIKPIVYSPLTKSAVQQNQLERKKATSDEPSKPVNDSLFSKDDDFPSLGRSLMNPMNRQRAHGNVWRN